MEEQYNKIVIPNEENVVIYYKIRQQLAKLGKEIEEYIHKPKYCLPFLQPGRLVKVKRRFFLLLLFGLVLFQLLSSCDICSARLSSLVYCVKKLRPSY
mgnify:CR=1 FL=1